MIQRKYSGIECRYFLQIKRLYTEPTMPPNIQGVFSNRMDTYVQWKSDWLFNRFLCTHSLIHLILWPEFEPRWTKQEIRIRSHIKNVISRKGVRQNCEIKRRNCNTYGNAVKFIKSFDFSNQSFVCSRWMHSCCKKNATYTFV